MNVFHRNEAIDAMLEAHAAGLISNENLSVGGEMISALYDAQPAAELSKWDGSPRIAPAEQAPAEWTSYRDGRRTMHYIRDAKGRYYVQKVEAGYAVSYLADEGGGVSVHLSVQPTLAAGKKWVVEHVEAAAAVGQLTLAEIKAKFEDEPMYECEIPGAPGRITLGEKAFERAVEVAESSDKPSDSLKALMRTTDCIVYGEPAVGVSMGFAICDNDSDPETLEFELIGSRVTPAACKAAVSEPLPHGTDTDGLPPGTYMATLADCAPTPGGVSVGYMVHPVPTPPPFKVCVPSGPVMIWHDLIMRPAPKKGHKVRTYKPHALGIDTFKVTYSARCNSLEDLRRLDAQDASVCRIEQELVQYAGKRRTPHRDRKVAKLRKILRILKRGIYC